MNDSEKTDAKVNSSIELPTLTPHFLEIKPSELDHLIHNMHLSGDLTQLTDQQVENILYALRSDPRFKIKLEQLPHIIHEMQLSGELKKLTDIEMESMIFSFKSAGLLNDFKDARHLTYDDDLLFTFNSADFLNNILFQQSYQLAYQTHSFIAYDMRWAVYIYCWAARYANNLPGDFVDYGAWRGGFARAQMHYIDFMNIATKNFYLLDPFWKLSHYNYLDLTHKDYYEEHFSFYDEVCETFAEFKNVKLIKGLMQDSLQQLTVDKICYLGINVFPYGFETGALTYLWDRIVSGGIIILGDYCSSGMYKRAKRFFEEFVLEKNTEILALPTGHGLIIKP